MMSEFRWTNESVRMCSMLASEPVSRLSTQITRWPRLRSSSHKWEPRKPAPPVTRDVVITRNLAFRSGSNALPGRHGFRGCAGARCRNGSPHPLTLFFLPYRDAHLDRVDDLSR